MAVENWIRYQLAVGPGCRKTGEMIGYFGSPENLFEAGEFEWKISGIFTASQIEKLKKSSLGEAYEVMENCYKLNCKTVTPDEKLYPRMIKPLDDLPAVLYYQGELKFLIHRIAIAIVGTREADQNSLSIAKSLSASITRSGGIIISGGALGIDSAAHSGALSAGGKTLAVLGCGFGTDYLHSNSALREQIAANGALVTEFPPLTQAYSRNFPIRNRIISGLCHGTVVIEAGVKSGSLITASLALEQGRDVYAVPGDVMSSKFLGVHKLISDGAKPVFSAYDVLSPYAMKYPKALELEKIENELQMTDSVEYINTKSRIEKKEEAFDKEAFEQVKDLSGLSEDAKTIYGIFTTEPIHIDDIARRTALDFSKIYAAVTELELWDFIEPRPGKLYIKK